MEIRVHREAPERPPVTDVVIYLNVAEAKLLCNFFGHLSRNKIGTALEPTTSHVADDTYNLTATLYDKLQLEGLE